MYQFGSGSLYGLAGAVPVARKFGAMQDISVDFSFNLKELYGQSQFPLTIARGQGKVEGKAKFASLVGGLVNDLFFGGTNATGQTIPIFGETGTIPATPFQITVVNGATFKEDLGVTVVATGLAMLRVASAPATGQYSVSAAGVYTFAAADTGKAVAIDYSYTAAASGNKTTISNLLSGTTPSFAIAFPIKYAGATMYLKLNSCISSKLTIATKIEDFIVPEFDFKAFADVSGVIGELSMTE